jgi:hypothetical protein
MKELRIDDNLPLIVDGVSRIPDDIEKLIFYKYFNQPLIVDGIKALPDNLQYIVFGHNFNQPLIVDGLKALPNSLQYIVLDCNFQNLITNVTVLPCNLNAITYKCSIDLFHIPLSVNRISRIKDYHIKLDQAKMYSWLQFKIIYGILPLPIAEEIAYNIIQ